MFLSGFASEAGRVFADQIAVTRELGWHYIESMFIGESELAHIGEAEFEAVAAALAEAGLEINCYASRIANWSRHPRREEDFAASREELELVLPRMRKLGIKMLRGMSFLVPKDETPDTPELEAIIFAKLNTLVRICADHGVRYGHENCMNYGGLSYRHTLKLLERVKSPALTLVFDTGNPVFTPDRDDPVARPSQSSWEFYRNVREFIGYVHIKDGIMQVGPDGSRNMTFTFPGEGAGEVAKIVGDLLARGYDGGFSIEPHMTPLFQPGDNRDDPRIQALRRRETYVEYGRRFERLLAAEKVKLHAAGTSGAVTGA